MGFTGFLFLAPRLDRNLTGNFENLLFLNAKCNISNNVLDSSNYLVDHTGVSCLLDLLG